MTIDVRGMKCYARLGRLGFKPLVLAEALLPVQYIAVVSGLKPF